MEALFKNRFWDNSSPRVTVITPVYNRDKELQRAMKSVSKLNYGDFEYIIVNDGSTIDIDNIVLNYMKTASFPVLYIKKENGGVHTARNVAIKHSRGEIVVCLDSDDELVPNALTIAMNTWDSIPLEEKELCREVCARCVNQNGIEMGDKFPPNINKLPFRKSIKLSYETKTDHIGFWRADTLKNNPWPEPEGITFVMEGTVWKKLECKYRSYFINNPLLIVHLENNESITRQNVLTTQTLKNSLWNQMYILNNWKIDQYWGIKNHIRSLFLYSIYKRLLKRKKIDISNFILKRKNDKFWFAIFYIPVLILSLFYKRKQISN